MDLFVVNRYMGDGDVKQPDEKALKEKFLSNIKARKRQVNDEVDSSVIVQPQKKSKKVNKVDSPGSEVETSGKVETEKVKKKRKRGKLHKLEKSLGISHAAESREEPAAGQFLILGDKNSVKKEKVKRVLPEWLLKPSVVSVNLKQLTVTVNSIPGLDKIFIKKLKKNGITHFFPVQSQLIPWLLNCFNKPTMYWPQDVCVSAPTGSGKTLAFVLPIAQALLHRVVPQVRALVVLPVQDLATQVYQVFANYCANTPIKVLLLSTVRPFKQEQNTLVKQAESGEYQSMADVVVTTPGRLVRHLQSTPGFSLCELQFLVIDEADRVMEGMQNDWMYHVNKHLYGVASQSYQAPALTVNTLLTERRPPQKLLFSATLSQDPEKLQQLGLFQPRLFTSVVTAKQGDEEGRKGEFVGKFTTPAELEELYTVCQQTNKPLVLHHVVTSRQWRHVLCFTKSAEAAHRLALVLKSLSRGRLKVARLAADLDGAKRKKLLTNFASGKLDVLVSTDSLARGIDIPGVKFVISYDIPDFVKTYVHRIGRTGRAGKEGTALTLLLPGQVNHFQAMLQTAGKLSVKELAVSDVGLEQYSETYTAALGAAKKQVQISKVLKLRKSKSQKKGKPLVRRIGQKMNIH